MNPRGSSPTSWSSVTPTSAIWRRSTSLRKDTLISRRSSKAQAALDKAEQEHAKRAAAIQAEVEALEKRSQTEKARWDKEKERLEAALRRARG